MISLKKLKEFSLENGLIFSFEADPDESKIFIGFENTATHCKWVYSMTFAEIDNRDCPVTAEYIISNIPKELYSAAPKNDP